MDVLRKIESKAPLFTKTQKAIADHLIAEPSESAMLTIQDLARRIRVSEATIVRFAQTLGFSGYQDLREALKQRLMRSISAARRIQGTLAELDESGRRLRSFIENQTSYVSDVAETVSQAGFAAACGAIAAAQHVYLFGDGASATPSSALGFWLNRFGVHVTTVQQAGRRLFDLVFQADHRDVLIAFSFGKESREAALLIDWMGSRKGSSVLITDLEGSASTARATHVLFVRRGPMESFHSMAPPVVLAEALALAVAQQLGERAIESATLLDQTRRKYGLE